MKNCEVPGNFGSWCKATEDACFLELEVDMHIKQDIDPVYIDTTIEACIKCPNYSRLREEIDNKKYSSID